MTPIGTLLLIVIGIAFVILLAGFLVGASERGCQERRFLLVALLVPVVVLVLWLDVMVLVVGPALHGL